MNLLPSEPPLLPPQNRNSFTRLLDAVRLKAVRKGSGPEQAPSIK